MRFQSHVQAVIAATLSVLALRANAAPPEAATPAPAPPVAAPSPPAAAKPAAPASVALPATKAAPPAATNAAPPPATNAAPKAAAVAPPAKPLTPAAAAANALRAAVDKLASEDPAVVRQAIETLTQLGSDAAANAVAARLGRGLPPQLAERALEALEHLGKPSVAPVLLELVLHRRPQIRSRAIEALGMLKVRSAQSPLLYALDDPSPEVREAAVRALAQVGNARALPALFTAAERGTPHALVAIGQLATQREVKAIVQRAKDGDVTRIKPALQTMLDRSDFPIAGKLAVVRELTALGPQSASNHLVQWLDARKADSDPRLRQALFDAIKRLDSAPGAETRVTKNVLIGGASLPAPASVPPGSASSTQSSPPAAPAPSAPPSNTMPPPVASPAAAPAAPARPQVAAAGAEGKEGKP